MTQKVRHKIRESAAQRRERLKHLDRRLHALVFIAALLSIPVAVQPGDITGTLLVVDILAWGIFVFEAVVKINAHGRREYLRNRWNWVDLGIIILSAPYHLATGVAFIASIGSIARLARLVRIALVVIKVFREGRSILSRRNAPAAVGVVALATVGAAGFVFVVESRADNPAFSDFGDSLWWAMVTLTTVGYGDISPTTTAGRIGAVILMLVGIGLLGTLAAALAAVFVGEEAAQESEVESLRREVGELRQSIETLVARLDK
ncbi:MAG: ion transporter [Acidimicrobiia bacterium]|nr:ion transporter [Acidimicrobiia bacterium]MBT8218154.1 ion transporter [Acidimicrobiia bacterium]NNF08966.1 ion transporter [Acidimicrobiia bacterium]NNL70904.1 ion transporter [Acidimicrobiia bacterium]